MGALRPGSICTSRDFEVDASTLAITPSPSPGPAGDAAELVLLAAGSLINEVAELQRKVDDLYAEVKARTEYEEKLAAYEFFSSFFDHYLPKRFLWQYVWGDGYPMTLDLQQMIDCNPVIQPMRCRELRTTLEQLQLAGRPDTVALDLACPAGAWTNGTLGQFTVLMRATLDYRSITDWVLAGKMSFSDTWDFDPKDFETGGRSFMGEVKTRFAYYTLPGKGFRIRSIETDFTYAASGDELQQGHVRRTVQWKGGLPQQVLDKVAELDMRASRD